MQDVQAFREQGYIFPLRVVPEARAAAWLDAFARREPEITPDRAYLLGFKAHLVFMWMYELATHPAVLDAVEALIGPNILVLGAKPWNKQPNDPRFISWHQDNAYFGLDPHDEVTAWTAISRTTPENGCMRFIPGSHRWDDQLHTETYDRMNLLARGQVIAGIDDAGAVDVPLEAGEMSIHHERTVHGSNGNSTGARRLGFSTFYIPTHVKSTIGRRGALLVRGTDEYGHWDADPIPQHDFDPRGIEACKRASEAYRALETQKALAES